MKIDMAFWLISKICCSINFRGGGQKYLKQDQIILQKMSVKAIREGVVKLIHCVLAIVFIDSDYSEY